MTEVARKTVVWETDVAILLWENIMTERGRCNGEVLFTEQRIVQRKETEGERERESDSEVSIKAFKYRNKCTCAKGLGAKEANNVLNGGFFYRFQGSAAQKVIVEQRCQSSAFSFQKNRLV